MSRFASARQALAGANAHHLPALEKLEKAHKNTPTLKQLREHPILGWNATARRLNYPFSLDDDWWERSSTGPNTYDRPWIDPCSTTTCLQETEMVLRECDEFGDDYFDRNDDVLSRVSDLSWCYDDDGTWESEASCATVITDYLSNNDSCVTAWMCYMNCHAECLCGDAVCGSFDTSVCAVSPAPSVTFAPTLPYYVSTFAELEAAVSAGGAYDVVADIAFDYELMIKRDLNLTSSTGATLSGGGATRLFKVSERRVWKTDVRIHVVFHQLTLRDGSAQYVRPCRCASLSVSSSPSPPSPLPTHKHTHTHTLSPSLRFGTGWSRGWWWGCRCLVRDSPVPLVCLHRKQSWQSRWWCCFGHRGYDYQQLS